MTRRALLGGALALGLFGVAAPAHGDRSPYWERVVVPGAPRAAELLAQALEWHRDAATGHIGPWDAICESLGPIADGARDAAVKSAVAEENALARLERARQLDPDNSDILYWQADVTAAWERPELGCAVSRRTEEALALYDTLRERDPSYRPEQVAFDRAILLTVLGRHAEAGDEYARAESLSALSPDIGVLAAGNLAEQRMLDGALPDAVAAYDRALARLDTIPGAAGSARSLMLFGRALAVERLGEHDAALDAARRAVQANDDSMAVLRAPGTFFVPRWEVHAYEALAQEARQAAPDAPPLTLAAARASRAEDLFASLDHSLSEPRDATTVAHLSVATATWLRALATQTPDDGAVLALRHALHDVPATTRADALASRQRLRRLAAAARSWTRFLNEGGGTARFAPSAREALTRLATSTSQRR